MAEICAGKVYFLNVGELRKQFAAVLRKGISSDDDFLCICLFGILKCVFIEYICDSQNAVLILYAVNIN